MATEKKKIPAATVQIPEAAAGAGAGSGKGKKAALAEKPANGAETTKKKPAASGTSAKKKTTPVVKKPAAEKPATGGKKTPAKSNVRTENTRKPKAEKPVDEPITEQTSALSPQDETALPVPVPEAAPEKEEPLPAVDFPESAVRAEKKSLAGRVLFILCIIALLLTSYFIFLYRPGSYSANSGAVTSFTDAEGNTSIVVNGTTRQQISGTVLDRQDNDRGTVCVLLIGDGLYVVKNRSVAKLADGVKDFTLSAKGAAVAYRDGADTLYYLRIGQKEAPVKFNNVHDGRYCLSPNGKELVYTWEQNGACRMRVYSTTGHDTEIREDHDRFPLAVCDRVGYLYYTDAAGALYLQTGQTVQKLAEDFEADSLCFNNRFDEALVRTAGGTLWVRRGTAGMLQTTDGTLSLLPNHMTAVRPLKVGAQYMVRTFARSYFLAENDGESRLLYLKGGKKAPEELTFVSRVGGQVTVTDKAVYFLLGRSDDTGRLDLYRVASGRTKVKRLLPDVLTFCPNVDGSRLLFVQDDGALYSSRVGLFRTVSKRLCEAVSTAYIEVTADDVFYFFRTDGTLCRSDNGDEYRAVSDQVEIVRVDGHLALFAVRGEDGKLHVYANYKNRRRDTEIAGGTTLLDP